MANFSERIKIIVDVVTDGAKSGLGNFKQAVSEAEGTTNKFKAGASSAFDTIQANAGVLAAGAGAALIGFGIKAVGAFDDVAKKAEEMAAATGLSIEQSSRWIAIADDIGISAETLQTSLGKVIKGLDKKVWQDYGIATHDAGGNIRSTNDILLDAFDTLSKIPAGSARAKAGTDLFGKGYAALAPLIGKSREEMVKYLSEVGKGQVITDAEAESGKQMRVAMDNLHDSLQEVTLAVGGMIAKGAPAISTLADIITKVLDLDSALSNLGQGGAFEGFFGTIADNVKGAAGAFVDMKDRAAEVIKYGPFSTTEQQKQQDWADHIKNLVVPSIDDLDRAHKNLAHGGMSDVEYQEDQNIAKAATYAEQVDKTQREVTSDINAMKAKWDELNGNITKEKALINYRQEVADTKQAMEDAGKAAKEHGVGSPEHVAALENARLKQLDLEQSTVDLAQKYTDLPPTVLTDVKAVIDAGSLDLLPETIQAAIDRKDYRVKAHLDTIVIDGETHAAGSTTIKVSNTPGGQFVRQFATGGVVPGPIGAPVPAIVHGGEEVIPVGGRSLSTPVTIINNFPPGVDPQSVALAQRKYFRRGGR